MKGTSLKLLIIIGGIGMVLNWRKILGWCILIPFILLMSYVLFMVIIVKPIVLVGIAGAGIFTLGIHLVVS